MAYSTDADIVKVQKDILELGVDDWTDQHNEAALIIDRAIATEWFAPIMKSIDYNSEFNPDLLLLPEQLLRLSVYKTLELAYLFLTMDLVDGAFTEKMKMFRLMYDDELKAVFMLGLSYDWNNTGSEPNQSNNVLQPRVITR